MEKRNNELLNDLIEDLIQVGGPHIHARATLLQDNAEIQGVHIAARFGDEEVMKCLLKHKAFLDTCTTLTQYPYMSENVLHIAASYDQVDLLKWIL